MKCGTSIKWNINYPLKRTKLLIRPGMTPLLAFGWTQRHYTQCKKLISKGYILYDSIYWTFSKWQNYSRGQISDWQGLGLGGRCDHKGGDRTEPLRGDESSISWLWCWLQEFVWYCHMTTDTQAHTRVHIEAGEIRSLQLSLVMAPYCSPFENGSCSCEMSPQGSWTDGTQEHSVPFVQLLLS